MKVSGLESSGMIQIVVDTMALSKVKITSKRGEILSTTETSVMWNVNCTMTTLFFQISQKWKFDSCGENRQVRDVRGGDSRALSRARMSILCQRWTLDGSSRRSFRTIHEGRGNGQITWASKQSQVHRRHYHLPFKHQVGGKFACSWQSPFSVSSVVMHR